MNYLLPYRYKKIGAIISSLGISLWLLMQLGFIDNLLVQILGKTNHTNSLYNYPVINIIIAVMGFFSFLLGLFYVAFSKEKIEDEMVKKIRLECYQFSALIQLILIFIGFLLLLIYKEPNSEGMILFFVSLLLLFWITFIIRFNYLVHYKLNNEK